MGMIAFEFLMPIVEKYYDLIERDQEEINLRLVYSSSDLKYYSKSRRQSGQRLFTFSHDLAHS